MRKDRAAQIHEPLSDASAAPNQPRGVQIAASSGQTQLLAHPSLVATALCVSRTVVKTTNQATSIGITNPNNVTSVGATAEWIVEDVSSILPVFPRWYFRIARTMPLI